MDSAVAALFPLGGLRKRAVRELAVAAGLPNAARAESMGICFVGKRKLRDFLAAHVKLEPGPIVDEAGAPLGEHAGALLYTLGQRQGLGLGGPGEPWYVIGKDVATNTVVAGRGHDHPSDAHFANRWRISTSSQRGQNSASWLALAICGSAARWAQIRRDSAALRAASLARLPRTITQILTTAMAM